MALLPQIQRWLMGRMGADAYQCISYIWCYHILHSCTFQILASVYVVCLLKKNKHTYFSHCIYWQMLDRVTFRLFMIICSGCSLGSSYCAVSGRQDQAQVWNARILTGAQWKTRRVNLLQIQRPPTERFLSVGAALQLFGSAACWIATVFKNEWEQHDITCTYVYLDRVITSLIPWC